MSDHESICPGCSSAIPPRAIALELQLECPACLMRLRVRPLYQANFLIASFVLGLGGAYLLGAQAHFVEVTFLLAFVFAAFLTTTILPLVPPRLDVR
jgi:hypothetical protein